MIVASKQPEESANSIEESIEPASIGTIIGWWWNTIYSVDNFVNMQSVIRPIGNINLGKADKPV